MIQLAWKALFVMALVVGLSGMFPGAALAQDPADAGNGTPTESGNKKLWHQAPLGLVSTDSTKHLEGPIDGHITLGYGLQSFRNLQGLDGRERNYDRSVFQGEGELSFVLNQEGAKGGGNPFRLGVEGDYENASDNDGLTRRSFEGLDVLDYYRMGGRVFLDIRSSEAVNGNLSYRARLGTGASYAHWGKFYGTMWDSRVVLESGINAGTVGIFDLGPIAGFQGTLMVGEHQSNWMLGEATIGLQAVSEGFTFRVDFLTTAGNRDANTVTGSFAKVQERWVHMGARVTVLLAQTVEIGAEWTHALDHSFEIDTPGVSYTSRLRSEGTNTYMFHFALRF